MHTHCSAVLFQNESVPSMLARITAVVGELPPYMVLEGREAFKYYTSAGVLYERSKSVEADETEPDGFNLVRYNLKLYKLDGVLACF
jgi:hypothetical protein